MRRILTAMGVVALAVATFGLVFVLGMRRKSPAVVDAVRRMNRAYMNPRQMATAGTPGAYASVLRHRGRTSGKAYETPVGAVATDDGFVIGLVYGDRSDWLRNVLAAGRATIVHEGRTYEVDRPDVVPFESAVSDFPEGDRRGMRLVGVTECLRLRHAS